jgi:hypothetical protein
MRFPLFPVALAALGLLDVASPARAEPSLDQSFVGRFFQAYHDEWFPPAMPAAPDPNAPLSRRPAPFPPAPQTQPPMPFTDWPFGGASTIGGAVPNVVVSPLMQALHPTGVGSFLEDNHIQIYGWVNGGFNISSNGQGRRTSKNANRGAMTNTITTSCDNTTTTSTTTTSTTSRIHMSQFNLIECIFPLQHFVFARKFNHQSTITVLDPQSVLVPRRPPTQTTPQRR